MGVQVEGELQAGPSRKPDAPPGQKDPMEGGSGPRTRVPAAIGGV
jgi:hypothetical protein